MNENKNDNKSESSIKLRQAVAILIKDMKKAGKQARDSEQSLLKTATEVNVLQKAVFNLALITNGLVGLFLIAIVAVMVVTL